MRAGQARGEVQGRTFVFLDAATFERMLQANDIVCAHTGWCGARYGLLSTLWASKPLGALLASLEKSTACESLV